MGSPPAGGPCHAAPAAHLTERVTTWSLARQGGLEPAQEARPVLGAGDALRAAREEVEDAAATTGVGDSLDN